MFTNLRSLNLMDTSITDVGLKELKALKSLRHVILFDTVVTNEGAKALQKAMPNLTIERLTLPR